MKSIPIILLGVSLVTCPAWAESAPDEELPTLRDQVQELTTLVQELSGTVRAQQARITELERSVMPPVALASAPAEMVMPSAPVATRTGVVAGLQAFNPEIGVVADVAGQLSESSAEGEGNDKLSVREVELIFGHPIDPYSRFDATITFSDFEEASLEEAYVTHWGLPGAMRAKLGRLRPKVGKAGAVHRDALDTADEPLVVQRYLGAEGLSRTGLELTEFIPVPWTALTHEVTVGTMEGGVGEGGTLFGETRRRPSFYAHLKNFWDISDMTNAELGTTYLLGSRDADSDYEVRAIGVDATLVHYVTPVNKLKWQNEAYFQHRDETVTFDVDPDTGDPFSTSVNSRPWGFYSLVDYRLGPRFGAGGRFDYVEPVDMDRTISARDGDMAWSGHLTFYQSEFARWRLQFRHTDFAEGGDDNTIFAQATVVIGVHKHQLQ